MKIFLGYYNKSVILTYIGAAAAVVGSCLAFSGRMNFALLCLIICGVCDLFDGMIARRCKRTEDEKEFGVQIDSLTDMLSFVAFPVVISVASGMNKWYHILIYIFYALASITRLGFFNVSSAKEGDIKSYRGLPVTFASLIITLGWIIGTIFSITHIVLPISLSVTALLFILDIKIPKPKGIAYILLALLAVALSVLVFFVGE